MLDANPQLDPLLKPKSIVVIGASQDPVRIGGRPFELARVHGYPGEIVGVNPKYTEVQGKPCFADIRALPMVPDLAILAIGANDVLAQLRECAHKGIKAAMIFAGGFAETGTDEGRELQRAVGDLAGQTGMLVAGPNSIGLVNVNEHMYASFMSAALEAPPKLGNVAVVAQSGGACIAVHHALHRRGVGLNYIVNTGNEVGVDFHDYVDYVTADPTTRVVIGYLEGLDDGERFIAQLSRLRDRDLPVVMYKVGETAAGADAAASHTARMAGSHAVFRAAFDQLGVMRADDIEQLAELGYLATFARRGSGLRAGILTTSGAFAAILTDKFVQYGLTVPELSEALRRQLRPHVPAFATVVNPVDITANVVNSPAGFGNALDLLLATDELDFIVLFTTSNLVDRLAPAIIEAVKCSGRLLALMVTGNPETEAAIEAEGVPVFHDTGRGARALASFAHRQHARAIHQDWRRLPWMPGACADAALRLVREARDHARTALDEYEGKRLLEIYGIEVAREAIARNVADAVAIADELGYPLVMKILSPDIVHKTDVGGVRLGIQDAGQVRAAYLDIMTSAAAACPSASLEGVVLQREESRGAELLLSCTDDPLFGPVLSVAFGGVTAELVADMQQRLLPLNVAEAESMLRGLRMYPLLAGYRNMAAHDLRAVAAVLCRLSELAMDLRGEVVELEINPLILRPGAQSGVVAVDCVVKLK